MASVIESVLSFGISELSYFTQPHAEGADLGTVTNETVGVARVCPAIACKDHEASMAD